MAIARSRRTGEEGEEEEEIQGCSGCCKRFLKFCLSHVGLCMIVSLYAVAGTTFCYVHV